MRSVNIQSKFVNALRTQGNETHIPFSGALPCPYQGHHGRMFQDIDQLYDHAIHDGDHEDWKHYKKLKKEQAIPMLLEAALKLR
jgi:hypothetical protein